VRIWIDLANSPHPLLFGPIAARLEELGHEVLVTARDNAQTVELTLERWPGAEVIGGPSPPGRRAKARTMAGRVADLRRWARRHAVDVALSHNSYGQVLAARGARIPAVTAMDYEFQPANHVAFRAATLILLPEALPLAAVRRMGARPRKVRRHRGLKEHVQLAGFEPDAEILARLGVTRPERGAVVVTRPPPSRAAYHRVGNPVYDGALQRLGSQAHVRVVALARHPEQREALRGLGLPNLTVPVQAVDARSLMRAADLVIGAGGTMTREAALLGVPTLTAFAGERPAVDRWLEAQGLLDQLTDPDQVADVRPRERDPVPLERLDAQADEVIRAYVSAVDHAVTGSR
jgi:hypothetical protein